MSISAEARLIPPSRASAPPWVIWLPAAVVTAAVLLPLVYLVIRAAGAGTALWEQLLHWRTAEILGRTAALIAAVTAVTVAVSVPLAWLTVRTDLPGRRAWSVLTALPLVIPSYVGALIVVAALGPRGIVQQWLQAPLGVERLPELVYGFPGAVLTLSLLAYPYVLLSVRAGLHGIDPSLEEAARNLGCGPWRTFFRIVLPQLAPAIAAGSLLVALYTLSDFGAVSLLRFDTFTRSIYLQYQSSFDRTLAAGLSLVLVAIMLVILAIEMRLRSRGRYYRTAAGSKRPAARIALGRWRWPALLFCGTVVLLGVLLPLGVLTFWVVQGWGAGGEFRLLWRPAVNSLYASALATAVTLAAAIPVAVYTVRYPGRLAVVVERTSYIGFALPGIVVALALVFFSIRTQLFYQTLPLLVFAYVVLFLPQGVGAIRTALLQVKPSLEEAGRSLGRTLPRVLWSVTLPLLRSGFVAGAGLVFLTVMKELPATLILGPIGFQTLATHIWSATDSGLYARAAAPSLLLILFASLPMTLLLWNERGGTR